MASELDTSIFGFGIAYGAEVSLNEQYALELSPGGIVLSSGAIVHFPRRVFPNYLNESDKSSEIAGLLKVREIFQLTDAPYNPATMDSFKQQHPGDIPAYDFLLNKIVGVYIPHPGRAEGLTFFLVSRDELARVGGVVPTTVPIKGGIFGRALKNTSYEVRDIEDWLFPALRLPVMRVRRFGYQSMAIESPPLGLQPDNIRNPFEVLSSDRDSATNAYGTIFFEYKNLLDSQLEQFQDLLEILHRYFGAFLTRKNDLFLDNFRKVLIAKWQFFLEEGEHLYYIQYFYDWLVDLVKAYDELVAHLDVLSLRRSLVKKDSALHPPSILLLGLVPEYGFSTQPHLFRETLQGPLAEREISEIRQLHWRLLMMIWTFDLPFLNLEKVLPRYGFDPGQEENLDSTNYWEWIDRDEDNALTIEDPPIKITPSRMPYNKLGGQAIPYYYPLDSNSEYSVHQFWDIHKTRHRQLDWHLSYNAHPDDKEKLGTDTENDSYSDRPEVLIPLAFHLREFPFLKVEGHIGKPIGKSESKFYIDIKDFDLKNELEKYNLALDVIAVNIAEEDNRKFLSVLRGLDHRTGLEQAQTLVFIFNANGEDIEFIECKKDDTPEAPANTILADFILPYPVANIPVDDRSKYYVLEYSSIGL